MDWRVGLGRGRIRFVWQRVGNEQGSVDDVRRRPSTSENVRALRGTPNPMVGGAAESKKSYMLASGPTSTSSTLFFFLSHLFGSSEPTRRDVEEVQIPLTQLRNRVAQPSLDTKRFAMKFGYVFPDVTRWT